MWRFCKNLGLGEKPPFLFHERRTQATEYGSLGHACMTALMSRQDLSNLILEVRPLEETLVGRNGQLFLSLVCEFDLGQAEMRKELARVKHSLYVWVLSLSSALVSQVMYPV